MLEGCSAYSGAALSRGQRLFEGGALSSKYGTHDQPSTQALSPRSLDFARYV